MKKRQAILFTMFFAADTIWVLYGYTGGFKQLPPFENFWDNKIYFWELTIYIIGIIGLIIFATSNFKKIKLLMFYLLSSVSRLPVFLIYCYAKIFPSQDNFNYFFAEQVNKKASLTDYLIILEELFVYIFFIWALLKFSKTKTAQIKIIQFETGAVDEIVVANRSIRFANRLIDAIFIISSWASFFFTAHFFNIIRLNNDYLTIAISLTPITIFYYLFMEGLFRVTPGKCITDTILINNSGERPKFGNVILRTLCRYIPFDAFSFLRGNAMGWHDTISSTYVAKSVDIENNGQLQ